MDQGLRIQVLGLCRFSFPADLNSFSQNGESVEARRAALYAVDRMEMRFLWFEHIAYRCVRHQTDKDFTLLVLLGEDFPEPYRARMEAMSAQSDQIQLIYRPAGDMRTTCREVMCAAREPDADVVAEFWLDDDDGIARNFVGRARTDFALGAAMYDAQKRLAIDYQKGVVVRLKDDGVRYIPHRARNWCAGQIVYLDPSSPKCTFDFPHYRVWSRMPTLTFSEQVMFLRGEHAMNDSKISLTSGVGYKMKDENLKAMLRRRFDFDHEAFEEGWDILRVRGDALDG